MMAVSISRIRYKITIHQLCKFGKLFQRRTSCIIDIIEALVKTCQYKLFSPQYSSFRIFSSFEQMKFQCSVTNCLETLITFELWRKCQMLQKASSLVKEHQCHYKGMETIISLYIFLLSPASFFLYLDKGRHKRMLQTYIPLSFQGKVGANYKACRNEQVRNSGHFQQIFLT